MFPYMDVMAPTTKKPISWGYITLGDKNYAYGLDLTNRRSDSNQEMGA